MGQATVKAIAEKILLLKTWSGRRGSNPRPTAWKKACRNAFNHIGAQGVDSEQPECRPKQGNFRAYLNGGLMEGFFWLT
jgi:hypothetical protein